ncbi:MAG: hypothetical protein WC866_00635 [Patescibacteria group bacterium]|jgi:hypothetical protein
MVETLIKMFEQAHTALREQSCENHHADHSEFSNAGWLDVGLSALVLELLFRYVALDLHKAEVYRAERREALSRAYERDMSFYDADVKNFVVPAVRIHGELFVREVWDVLRDRLPKRRILRDTVRAVRESGLPDDIWLYLEPQIDRYAPLFGLKLTGLVGGAKKFGMKKIIQRVAHAPAQDDGDE